MVADEPSRRAWRWWSGERATPSPATKRAPVAGPAPAGAGRRRCGRRCSPGGQPGHEGWRGHMAHLWSGAADVLGLVRTRPYSGTVLEDGTSRQCHGASPGGAACRWNLLRPPRWHCRAGEQDLGTTVPPGGPAADAVRCPALKMPMSEALCVPMAWGEKPRRAGPRRGFRR